MSAEPSPDIPDAVVFDLWTALTTCRHCGAAIEEDPRQGGLLVHGGTRSRRCAGVDSTTEAEIGPVPL